MIAVKLNNTNNAVVKTAEVDADAYVKAKVTNRKQFDLTLSGKVLGDCILASMKTYKKLRKAGAKRMRGKRQTEIELDRVDGTGKNWHYWVENKGIVFDESAGMQQIVRKDVYYEVSNMHFAEEAQVGLFFSDEIPPLSQRTEAEINYFRNLPDEVLSFLIKAYENDDE